MISVLEGIFLSKAARRATVLLQLVIRPNGRVTQRLFCGTEAQFLQLFPPSSPWTSPPGSRASSRGISRLRAEYVVFPDWTWDASRPSRLSSAGKLWLGLPLRLSRGFSGRVTTSSWRPCRWAELDTATTLTSLSTFSRCGPTGLFAGVK